MVAKTVHGAKKHKKKVRAVRQSKPKKVAAKGGRKIKRPPKKGLLRLHSLPVATPIPLDIVKKLGMDAREGVSTHLPIDPRDVLLSDPLLEEVADESEVVCEEADRDDVESNSFPVNKKFKRSPKSKTVIRKQDYNPAKTVFDLRDLDSPLVGTPKEVQEELDGLALSLQDDPDNQAAFEKILAYIHKYLLGLVFKKYNFVKGYEETDMYQEALIALFKKAVPNFDPTRNMSFLNFAKMCINRHLITILHASKHRRKDMPLNLAISLDHNPSPGGNDDDDGSCSLANIIPDEKTSDAPYLELAKKESYARTLEVIRSSLSPFEIIVLDEYLGEKSYREAAKSITKKLGARYNEKSVDNALLRIRKKAVEILDIGGEEAIPLIQGAVPKKCNEKSVDNALGRIRKKVSRIKDESQEDFDL